MNPCPCGYYEDNEKECKCSAHEVAYYQKKISGPLLDRIDLQIRVPRVKIKTLSKGADFNSESQLVREKVLAARKIQQQRFGGYFTNSDMSSKKCDQLIKLDLSAKNFIDTVLDKALISARGYYRILKVGQTIADLEKSSVVTGDFLSEAFSYRLKD